MNVLVNRVIKIFTKIFKLSNNTSADFITDGIGKQVIEENQGKTKLSNRETTTSEDTPNFKHLICEENNYSFTEKKMFVTDGTLKEKTIQRVFNFAYEMTFGHDGEHRDHRSGGSHRRKNGEIFANTFQGKLAECAASNFFHKTDKTSIPDFSILSLGEWDTSDLTVLGKEIAIKSTKNFGQLLLLEKKDWDAQGRYIPNLKSGSSKYDFILLIRMKPCCEDIMKKARMLYSDTINKEELYKLLIKESWEYNYAGFITHDELKYIINNNYIIPKGASLNGHTKMDADNYYIQARDMHNINELEDILND